MPPAVLAVPSSISAFEPLSSILTLCTAVPLVVNSSMNIVLPLFVNVCVPSPRRSTTMLPGANAAARAGRGDIASSTAAVTVARVGIDFLLSSVRLFFFIIIVVLNVAPIILPVGSQTRRRGVRFQPYL